MRKYLSGMTCFFTLYFFLSSALSFAQKQTGSTSNAPWILAILFSLVGFIFHIVFSLLFSFWGWLIILFILVPLYKDKIGYVNRRRSFLRSQQSALMNPRDANARYQLGLIYLKGKKYKGAERYFNESVDIDNTNPEYYFVLGKTLQYRKKFQDAIEAYLQALSLDKHKGYGDIQLGLGNCYFGLKKLSDARVWFEKAIESNTSLAESYFKLALTCEKLGDRNKIKSLLQECKSVSSHSPAFLKSRNRKWGYYASIYPLVSRFY